MVRTRQIGIYLICFKVSPCSRAGITDSSLTTHGVLQIEHLGQHFSSQSIRFDCIFASDLSRARLTAEGICRHQPQRNEAPALTPILTPDLRERGFGSLEGERWTSTAPTAEGSASPAGQAGSSSSTTHIESESKVSMKNRATSFVDEHLLPLIFDDLKQEANIAVVSHGIMLRVLWSRLVQLFDPMHISIAPGIPLWNGEPAAFISPVWSNTGYMMLSIQEAGLVPEKSAGQQSGFPAPDPATCPTETSVPDAFYLLHGWSLQIQSINSKEHLAGLRRTRGGIGSATHDTRQKKIDQFFK